MGYLKDALSKPYIAFKDWMDNTNEIGVEDPNPPEIFNRYGEKMKLFFLKDSGCLITPYSLSSGRVPRNILWDRYNVSLDTHFYVHEHIFNKTYECVNKIGVLRESENIIPRYYDMALKRPDIINGFTKILTHSARILDKYENAEFAPACSVWYGTETHGGKISLSNYELKTKNVSIIASAKEMCELHKLRGDLARHYKNDDRVDAYGSAVGNYISRKSDALEQYRYSIVIENSVTTYYFTEKIMDCFASMTVPIYVGASNIADFFDENGIIRVNESTLGDFSSMDKIIEKCCKEDYEERYSAIIENFNRVQEYLCWEDYLFKRYPDL